MISIFISLSFLSLLRSGRATASASCISCWRSCADRGWPAMRSCESCKIPEAPRRTFKLKK